MKFVEDDGGEIGQQRIRLQPRGQDAFGDDEQAGVGAEAPLETHLPADFAAERPAALVGDARRDRACGHAARLQQDDRAVRDQRRRNSRRLAGAGRRGNDRRARTAYPFDDAGDERVYREWGMIFRNATRQAHKACRDRVEHAERSW